MINNKNIICLTSYLFKTEKIIYKFQFFFKYKARFPPRGPCLRVTGVAYPGFRCWYRIFFPWPIDQYPFRGPGVYCRWQRPDHLRMAQPKGKVERRGRPPWYKTEAVVLPRQRVEASRYKTRALVTLRLWAQTSRYKTGL